MPQSNDAIGSKRRAIIIAIVICVSLTSLAAGLIWRQWVTDSQASAQHIDHLRQFENHWEALNTDLVRVDDWTGKIVLLNFWGSWCPPCIAEMPLLDKFNAQRDELQIVGIVVDEVEAAKQFLQKNNISFPSLMLNQNIVTNLLQTFENKDLVLPYSVAFDQNGKRLMTHAGPLELQDLQDLVE